MKLLSVSAIVWDANNAWLMAKEKFIAKNIKNICIPDEKRGMLIP